MDSREHLAHARALVQAARAAAHVASSPGEVVGGLVRRVLSIKATPATYTGIVSGLRAVLGSAWGRATDEALEELVSWILSTQGSFSEATIKRQINAYQRRLSDAGIWDEHRARPMGAYLAAAYQLGKAEVARPMGWSVDFSLADQDAVHGLQRAGLFWVGKFYGAGLPQERVLEIVGDVLVRQGLGREAAGAALRRELGTLAGNHGQAYWSMFAGVVATRARSFGALQGMVETGATRYRYTNPDDERTSDVCRELNGAEFTVKGAVDLRDQLLANATTPEQWKTLAPWPRNVEAVRGADGARLPEGELLARGIAWPPLHGNCRSSIDVVTWAPISSLMDDPGDVTPKKQRPPRKPKPPPAAPPAPAPTPTPAKVAPAAPPDWRTAKKALDEARKALKAAKLNVDVMSLAPDDLTRIRSHIESVERQGISVVNGHAKLTGTLSSAYYGAWRKKASEYTHRSLVELEGQLRDPASPWRSADLADLVRSRRAMYGDVVRAQAALERLAPADVREELRKALTLQLLPKYNAKQYTPEQWAKLEQSANHALRAYPAEVLQVLVHDREAARDNPKNSRAHAAQGTMNSPGHVEQALGDLVEGATLPGGKKVWLMARGRAPATLVHEFGHRLDGIHADGVTGQLWRERDDWPTGGRLYESTYGRPFDAAKALDKNGRPMAVEMAYETSEYNRYAWAGKWVNQYEGRIYHGAKGAPDPSLLAKTRGEGGKAVGPVEFIAMANQYVAEGQQAMERASERTGISAARALREAMSYSSLDKGRNYYGASYRDGLEGMYRGGERHVRWLADTGSYKFKSEADVVSYAATVGHWFGTPLEALVGVDGTLTRYLGAPLSAEEIAAVRKGMPAAADSGDYTLTKLEDTLGRNPRYAVPARRP